MDKSVNLVYSDLTSPGYSRRKAGRGFYYVGKTGRKLKDPGIIKYCKSLVIPPAWQEVWISSNRNAHILSTGLDQKERKQYIYHPAWSDHQNQIKFSELLDFGKRLPVIREAVEKDLNKRKFSKRRIVSAVIRMIDSTLIRIGNETYSKENKTYGATTLLERHVDVSGKTVTLDFRGKSGKQRQLDVTDAKLAQTIRFCQELPGQRLFQYLDNNKKIERINSADINDYLKEVSGADFTAKTFRTWGGTVSALEYAADQASPKDGKKKDGKKEDAKKLEIATVKHTAKHLGNTVAMARKYYIHPELLASIKSGEVPSIAKRRRKGLSRSETSVLQFLSALSN